MLNINNRSFFIVADHFCIFIASKFASIRATLEAATFPEKRVTFFGIFRQKDIFLSRKFHFRLLRTDSLFGLKKLFAASCEDISNATSCVA